MYNLSDFEQAELLMALPPAAGDVRPSELMDHMKALMRPEELDWPSILNMNAFLTRLPADIRTHCVPFVATGSLADVARRADVQFLARPSVQPQVFEDCVPQDEEWEYNNIPALDRSVNNFKLRLVAQAAYCYYNERFCNRARSCRQPCSFKSENVPGRRN